jgi:hypothetical protein
MKARVLRLVNGIWAIPAILMMRFSRRFILLQLCGIRADRIEHFVSDSAEQFVRFPLYGSKKLSALFSSK